MMPLTFLQATPPHTGSSLIIMLILIALWLLVRALKKTGFSTMAYIVTRKYFGASNPWTTYFLKKAIKKMISEDGLKCQKVEVIHQFGNCYHGVAIIERQTHNLSVVADKYGTISFTEE